jgi:putative membrane protein
MNADLGGTSTTGTKPAPSTQVDLAFDRTYLAHERTLMAWLRTAMSLVTFGFTLFKAFLYLEQSGKLAPSRQVLGPRTYGIIIIAVGLFALIAAIVQHVRGLNRLRLQTDRLPRSIALVPALVFAGVAVLALGVSLFEHL